MGHISIDIDLGDWVSEMGDDLIIGELRHRGYAIMPWWVYDDLRGSLLAGRVLDAAVHLERVEAPLGRPNRKREE